MKDHKTENVYFYDALIDRDGVVNGNAMEVSFGFRLLDRAADYVYCHNRRFPKITGEDNLTVFSYSGRVKSPEWRWQRRRADLRHFEIFRLMMMMS